MGSRQTAATARYDWILAITFIAYIFSAASNGANDVANSYATSVAARTLTMKQVGPLALVTEFVGAVALGERVTSTIKNGIITIDRFEGNPGTLMLAMGCAEVGSATWLTFATMMGMPVSTTQTIVGALIGVGFASQSDIKWSWQKGSVSQVAASWGIAPALAGAFAALVFGLVKYSVLERKDSFAWALRLIPFYFALTASILALFITIEAPGSDLDALGAGTAVGIILGVFFGALIVCYIFFVPFFKRKLIRRDTRLRPWHILYDHSSTTTTLPSSSQARVRSRLRTTTPTTMARFMLVLRVVPTTTTRSSRTMRSLPQTRRCPRRAQT